MTDDTLLAYLERHLGNAVKARTILHFLVAFDTCRNASNPRGLVGNDAFASWWGVDPRTPRRHRNTVYEFFFVDPLFLLNRIDQLCPEWRDAGVATLEQIPADALPNAPARPNSL